MWNILGPLSSPKTGTDRGSNMSLSDVVTLIGMVMEVVMEALVVHTNEEAGVPSSDVELTLDLVPVRMVFTEAVRPSLLHI